MFGNIRKMFIELVIGLVSVFNHTKCASLSNQKYDIRPTFITLHPKEYSQEFHYYPCTFKLDTCGGTCNTVNHLSNKICVPNKQKI